jgi:hypothetical protein
VEVKDIIRLPDPKRDVRADVREVVRDVNGKPQTFIRVRLTGYYFPEGAREYALLIGDAVSRFSRVGPKGLSLSAYFDRPLPPARTITLVYGRVVMADFNLSVSMTALARLDRQRLPEGIVDLLH